VAFFRAAQWLWPCQRALLQFNKVFVNGRL
jgi:hypothetical protein